MILPYKHNIFFVIFLSKCKIVFLEIPFELVGAHPLKVSMNYYICKNEVYMFYIEARYETHAKQRHNCIV